MAHLNQSPDAGGTAIPDALQTLKRCSQRVEAMAYSLVGKGTAHDLAELIRIAAIIEAEVKAIQCELSDPPPHL